MGAAPRQRGRSEAWTLTQQTVGHHHHQVGGQGAQVGDRPFVPEGRGLEDRQALGQGGRLDRAGGELAAASRRSVRLGVDGDDLLAGRQQGLQAGHREVRGAGEDDA